MRLLVLLAVLLASAPLSDAQHVNFYRMSSNGCATGVKSDTGYSAPVIKYGWRKYRERLLLADPISTRSPRTNAITDVHKKPPPSKYCVIMP